jgi:hypothetical protein
MGKGEALEAESDGDEECGNRDGVEEVDGVGGVQ